MENQNTQEQEVQVDFINLDQELQNANPIPIEEIEEQTPVFIEPETMEADIMQNPDTPVQEQPETTTNVSDDVAYQFKCNRIALDYLNMVFGENCDYKNAIEPIYYGTLNLIATTYSGSYKTYNKLTAVVVDAVSQHLINIISSKNDIDDELI